ncbi:hypothetical protein EDC04DRAFT_2772014 [Pisolithus marmoratus]|nr:hypothetical protein EDC04DRAFT_2772014 [Pisolithus marmoratus]
MAEGHPPSSKLRLKRTPAEKENRARRKAFKAARKAAKRARGATADGYLTSDSSGSKETPRNKRRKHRRDNDADDSAPQPSPLRETDSDAIRAKLEEEAFMEKMWEAFEDDEHLDTTHSKFNSYIHIPDRWANDRTGKDSHLAKDPQYMDDDEYAEWVREGMWRYVNYVYCPLGSSHTPRRKHAREYEERVRKVSERAARRDREAQARAETARLEKAASERRERKRQEKEELREHEYQLSYETRWQELLNLGGTDMNSLAFTDIPWPLFPGFSTVDGRTTYHTHKIEDFTEEAISRFLTVLTSKSLLLGSNTDKYGEKVRKEKLREMMLRFHPDKFEGRVMQRVLATDKDRVREAVGQIVRVLNALMGTRS